MPDTIEERLRKLRGQQVSGLPEESIEARLARLRAQPPAQQPEGAFSSFQTGVAGPLLRNVVETAADLYNAPGETLERVGRGALEFVSAFDPAGAAYEPTKQDQAARMAELNRRADERLPEPIKSMKAGMAIEEAKPRTRAGRVAGVTGSILGEVAFPTAPENVAGNIVTAPFGGAATKSAGVVFKSGVNAVRRVFGKGAAQIIEAEALPAATAQVRQSVGEVPPVVREAPRTVGQAASKQPTTVMVNGQPHRVTVSARDMGDGIRVTAIKLHDDATGTYRQIIPPDKGARFGSFDEAEEEAARFVQQAYGQPGVGGAATAPPPAQLPSASSAGNPTPTVQRAISQFDEAVQRINASNLTPKQKAAELDAAIAAISREARGASDTFPTRESMVQSRFPRQKNAPPMIMPENPNPIQQAGRLPGEPEFNPPPLEADLGPQSFGVSRAPEPAFAEISGPRVTEPFEMAAQGGGAQPPAGPPAFGIDDPFGPRWANQPVQQSLIDATARTPWQDTTLAYFRANLLTNPVGRALDLGSTVINQFADAAVRPVAAAVDVIVSKLNGSRSITGPSLRGTGQAFGSIRQGLRDAKEVLKTGRQAIESGAEGELYGSEIRSGLGKVADVPVNGLFRVMGALDAPFRRFGYARNLFDRARVAAINEAKRGKIPWEQKNARIRELMDSDGIIKAAVRDGEKAVLSESNKVSAWVSSQTRNSPNARLAFGIIQPFMRIPLNAVLKAADLSGLGGVKALYKVARGVGRKAKGQTFFRDLEDQRIFSQNVAAGSFAPAAFMLGMELEQRGKLEGYYYTSKKDFPNGKTPTSVNIGGENYDINRLGGFIAAPLFVGATYNRLRKQDVGKANALLRSFSGLVQQAPALGYYGAPAKAGRILTADEPGNVALQEAGGIASGFIPASGALGAAAKATDSGKKRKAEGFTGPIMDKIPGLRQLLPEKWTGSAVIDAAIEPNRPLFSELQRLNKRVSELQRKTKQVYKNGKWTSVDDESDDKFNARVQQFGQNYTKFGMQLISSPRFQTAPDAVKDIALDRLDQRAKAVTRREGAFPELELDANTIMDAAENSKKNPANK